MTSSARDNAPEPSKPMALCGINAGNGVLDAGKRLSI